MKDEKRFEYLMSMAMGGDECAPGDLLLEFGYWFPVSVESGAE